MKFNLITNGENEEVNFDVEKVYILAFTGRNIKKTKERIKELEDKLGVVSPAKIPSIFECSLELLTQSKDVKFIGDHTSGEVEYVIFVKGEKIYISIGSDHTDRKLKSVSLEKAKQVCPKPIGKELWDYSDLKNHWDGIRLISYQIIDGKEVKYQGGTLAEIFPVEEVLEVLRKRVGDIDNSIIYSGTVPVIDGFKYGESFRGLMVDDVLGRKIEFAYKVSVISEEER